MKPEKNARAPIYDWDECVKYVQKKYDFKITDFAGKFKDEKVNHDVEYQNFWHWLCEFSEIHNGGTFCMWKDTWESLEEGWIKTIYGYFIEEFADEAGAIEFEVSW